MNFDYGHRVTGGEGVMFILWPYTKPQNMITIQLA